MPRSAAAGYLNYSSKKEVAGAEVYEAGMMDISDSDILAENQAKNGVDDGKLKEIASLDGDGEELLPDGNEVAAMPESAESAGAEVSGQETAAAGIENPGEAVLTGGTGQAHHILDKNRSDVPFHRTLRSSRDLRNHYKLQCSQKPGSP